MISDEQRRESNIENFKSQSKMITTTSQKRSYSHQIKEFAEMNVKLLSNGGPPENAELFDQVTMLQDNILKCFGLPRSSDSLKLLWFDRLPTDEEVDGKILQLHKTAIHYLLANSKTELQILKEAQEQNLDAFVVLPELRIKTYTYTVFVYEKILLKRKDTVENILHELRLVNNAEILDSLGRVGRGIIDDHEELVVSLQKIGVKYLQQFITNDSNQ